MKFLCGLAMALLLAGCANVTLVNTGEQPIGEHLLVKPDNVWNEVSLISTETVKTWTIDGLPLDQLVIYSGIKDGERLNPRASGETKPVVFRANMRTDEVVHLFESLMTGMGGSMTVIKLEPTNFAGSKGFRFEYEMVRRDSEVPMRGVAYGTVHQELLYAILFMAPRRGLYPRYISRVEQLAASAQLR